MHISWRLFRFTQKWISHSVIRTMCLIESTKSGRIPRKIVSKGFPEQFWCRVHSTTLLPCPYSTSYMYMYMYEGLVRFVRFDRIEFQQTIWIDWNWPCNNLMSHSQHLFSLHQCGIWVWNDPEINKNVVWNQHNRLGNNFDVTVSYILSYRSLCFGNQVGG